MSPVSPVKRPPKLLLFDVGGVCVASPFQVIAEYEKRLGIPRGWLNYAIAYKQPHGAWQRAERGELYVDGPLFLRSLHDDLHDDEAWFAFLADRVGLPQPHYKEGDVPVPEIDVRALFADMMQHTLQHPNLRLLHALQHMRQEYEGEFLIGALSNTYRYTPTRSQTSESSSSIPTLPYGDIAADLGSNYSLFSPQDLDRSDPLRLRSLFHFFISSAHAGLRKPDPRIYQLAVERANQIISSSEDSDPGVRPSSEDSKASPSSRDPASRTSARPPVPSTTGPQRGRIEPDDVLFFDDIGRNLQVAQAQGFRTIKVPATASVDEAADQILAILERETHVPLGSLAPPPSRL